MSKDKNQASAEHARKETETAVKHGENISDDVRNITIEALSKHHLNFENMKSVIKAVLEGAKDAVDQTPVNMRESLKEVIQGLDEALEKSAQASKLAIEETAGNLKDFSKKDINRAMDDLRGIEEIFFESLADVAKSSQSLASETIQNLAEHLKNSGTVVGQRASEEVIALSELLEKTGEKNIATVTNATRAFSMDVAHAASGFLTGIVDSINKVSKDSSNKTAKKKTRGKKKK